MGSPLPNAPRPYRQPAAITTKGNHMKKLLNWKILLPSALAAALLLALGAIALSGVSEATIRAPGAHAIFPGHSDRFGFGDRDKTLILSETRYLSDGETHTIRKLAGAIQSVDATTGAFTLLLADASETLSLTANADATIKIAGADAPTLSDLTTDTTTYVIQYIAPDASSQIKLIAQGDFTRRAHHADKSRAHADRPGHDSDRRNHRR